MKRLENKVAIVTGGASGIGKAAVVKFAGEGAMVSIWDVNAEKGAALVAELTRAGHQAEFRQVNVASLAEVTAAITGIVAQYGHLDVLVNNAGITRDATLMKMSEEQFDQVIDINLKGVFNCTKAAAAVMVGQKSGSIISTSSVVGLYGNFGQTNYVAAKAGIIGMTRVWARELGRKGVRANVVAPGFIATEMTALMPENILTAMKEKIPLGRMGSVDDIANAYLFLASDEAAYINGAVLQVDGGIIP